MQDHFLRYGEVLSEKSPCVDILNLYTYLHAPRHAKIIFWGENSQKNSGNKQPLVPLIATNKYCTELVCDVYQCGHGLSPGEGHYIFQLFGPNLTHLFSSEYPFIPSSRALHPFPQGPSSLPAGSFIPSRRALHPLPQGPSSPPAGPFIPSRRAFHPLLQGPSSPPAGPFIPSHRASNQTSRFSTHPVSIAVNAYVSLRKVFHYFTKESPLKLLS